jgi:LuxR family maltose regulon positive regulatory protein
VVQAGWEKSGMLVSRLGLPAWFDPEGDADILILRRSDGTEVAAFSARSVEAEFVRQAAEKAARAVRPDTHLRVRLFGNFAIFRDGELLPLGTNTKAIAILKCLVVNKDRPVSRDYMMGWLWPESSLKKANWSLNSAVRALRKVLDDRQYAADFSSHVELVDGGYRLSPSLRISTDVDEFDGHYRRGRDLEKQGRISEATVELEKAAELYLADYLLEDLYEDWTMVERERLVNVFVDALSRLAGFYVETGRLQDAIGACYRILSVEPCHESTHRTLMECLLSIESPTLALRQYRLCEEVLRLMHGIRPSPEIEALYQRILKRARIRD